MAVSKELRAWNYAQYRKMGKSVKEANNLKNRSIENTWNELKNYRKKQHEKGKRVTPYPKVPEKIVAKKYKNEKVEFFKSIGMKPKAAGKFGNLSWQKYFAQKARMQGFIDFMEKKGMNWKKELQKIQKQLGETYKLSEFFKAFRAWYMSTFGVRG